MTKLEKENWRNKVLYEGLIGVGGPDWYHNELDVDGHHILVNMDPDGVWEVWVDQELTYRYYNDFLFLTYLNIALFGEAE